MFWSKKKTTNKKKKKKEEEEEEKNIGLPLHTPVLLYKMGLRGYSVHGGFGLVLLL